MAKTRFNNTLQSNFGFAAREQMPPKFAASSLNGMGPSPATIQLSRGREVMTQHSQPDPAAPVGNRATDELGQADGEPPSEPAVERSRFSQWLASFGLGEFQNPLLTRTRPPAPRRRT
jgi:hypothetical protein